MSGGWRKSASRGGKEMSTISGWTPKTTLLLHGTTGGYDIIDHAFGSTFPSDLLQELMFNGWIGDPSTGTSGRLQKARTKMDVDLDEILQLSIGGAFLRDSLVAAEGNGVRGDESAFISRDMRREDSFPKEYPRLHRLISSIENAAFDHLRHNTNGMDANDESTYFVFNKDLTSVQLARYPGNGNAGYPRHCDLGATCGRKHHTVASEENERILTFVYYLTPDEWDVELDGGALRMFYSPAKGYNDDESGSEHYFDVTPFSDRMVVFRSDCIEHQVMPSLRRERIAITVWLYGRVHEKISPITHKLDLEQTKNSEKVKSSLVGSDFDRLSVDNSKLPPALPLPDSITQEGQEQETIFVAIPSYRDEETLPTLQSLLQTAHYPERVNIGVVWQVDTLSPGEVQRFTCGFKHMLGHQNFRSITMDYRQATGPCYARYLAQTLHRGEDYVLQIDSHMRFRPNWDVYLIHQLNKCNRSISSKPPRAVLTTYPPNYDAPHGPGPNAETRCTMLVPWKFGEDDGMLRQKGRLLRSDYIHNETSEDHITNDNIPCLLFAGGFNFFHSELLDCCPYDDKLHGLFFGEEISMAVRLYTLGYDLYSPPQTVCYHQWKRNPARTRDPSGINNRDQEWLTSQRGASLEVVRKQLQGLGRGLGKERTVEQFSIDLGVNFDKFLLSQGCENGKLSMNAFATSNDAPMKGTGFDFDDMGTVLKLVNNFIK